MAWQAEHAFYHLMNRTIWKFCDTSVLCTTILSTVRAVKTVVLIRSARISPGPSKREVLLGKPAQKAYDCWHIQQSELHAAEQISTSSS